VAYLGGLVPVCPLEKSRRILLTEKSINSHS